MSGKSIGALKKKGLSDKAVTELRSMEDVYFESPETFIQRVNQLESADEIMAREKQLLRAAKGYFRLDRWIKNKTLREWVEAIIFALVVATIVRTYLFAPFQIPSGSMIPTIQIGDHIF
ncbi:MAG: S26 family signal peptidase, partial [SAR324 cluster bacterium]|nr:S26 family signal peptidase [SAR324 cluster bacterium]